MPSPILTQALQVQSLTTRGPIGEGLRRPVREISAFVRSTHGRRRRSTMIPSRRVFVAVIAGLLTAGALKAQDNPWAWWASDTILMGVRLSVPPDAVLRSLLRELDRQSNNPDARAALMKSLAEWVKSPDRVRMVLNVIQSSPDEALRAVAAATMAELAVNFQVSGANQVAYGRKSLARLFGHRVTQPSLKRLLATLAPEDQARLAENLLGLKMEAKLIGDKALESRFHDALSVIVPETWLILWTSSPVRDSAVRAEMLQFVVETGALRNFRINRLNVDTLLADLSDPNTRETALRLLLATPVDEPPYDPKAADFSSMGVHDGGVISIGFGVPFPDDPSIRVRRRIAEVLIGAFVASRAAETGEWSRTVGAGLQHWLYLPDNGRAALSALPKLDEYTQRQFILLLKNADMTWLSGINVDDPAVGVDLLRLSVSADAAVRDAANRLLGAIRLTHADMNPNKFETLKNVFERLEVERVDTLNEFNRLVDGATTLNLDSHEPYSSSEKAHVLYDYLLNGPDARQNSRPQRDSSVWLGDILRNLERMIPDHPSRDDIKRFVGVTAKTPGERQIIVHYGEANSAAFKEVLSLLNDPEMRTAVIDHLSRSLVLSRHMRRTLWKTMFKILGANGALDSDAADEFLAQISSALPRQDYIEMFAESDDPLERRALLMAAAMPFRRSAGPVQPVLTWDIADYRTVAVLVEAAKDPVLRDVVADILGMPSWPRELDTLRTVLLWRLFAIEPSVESAKWGLDILAAFHGSDTGAEAWEWLLRIDWASSNQAIDADEDVLNAASGLLELAPLDATPAWVARVRAFFERLNPERDDLRRDWLETLLSHRAMAVSRGKSGDPIRSVLEPVLLRLGQMPAYRGWLNELATGKNPDGIIRGEAKQLAKHLDTVPRAGIAPDSSRRALIAAAA